MTRFATLLLALAAAQGQGKPDSLAALRQAAEKSAAEWDALAKGLDQKIEHLLPCDPAGKAAVEEISRASAARLGALSAYVKAEAAAARENTEAAKRALAAQAALGGTWAAERAESDQDHTAIEAQIAELKESMRKRSALNGAEQTLMELSRLAKERAAKAEEQAGRKDVVNLLLGDLISAYQLRQTALEQESALVDAESARWSFYYATRLARAATECAIINGAAAPKKREP
ncbi:MAG TPA: hypothetical protein VMT15_10330 [Bryobacteraceae bacterium]|nr:hypothetical protein [Bryobacteraceae bacterium]